MAPPRKSLRAVTVGGRSSFLNPETGEQFWVDEADAQEAVDIGFEPESAPAYVARVKRERLETPGMQAASTLLGAARGLSLGASDVVLRGLSPSAADTAQELREVNPGLSTGGEAVGTVGGLLVPGAPLRALSGAARAASAGRMARAATVPAGQGGRVARAATQLAPRAAQFAAEGGAIGAGQAVSDAALRGDTDDLIGQIAEQATVGAATGVAAGAALGVAGKAIKGVGKGSKVVGKKIARGVGLPSETGAKAEKIVAEGIEQIGIIRRHAAALDADQRLLGRVSTPRVEQIVNKLAKGTAEEIEAAGGRTSLRAELRDLTFDEARRRGVAEVIATRGFTPVTGVPAELIDMKLGVAYKEIGKIGKRVRRATGVDIEAGRGGFGQMGDRLRADAGREIGYRLGGRLGAYAGRFIASGGLPGIAINSPAVQAVARAGATAARIGADQLAVATAAEIRRREASDATYELPAAPDELPDTLPETPTRGPDLPSLLAERQRLQQTIGDLPQAAETDRQALTGQVQALSEQIQRKYAAHATAQAIRGGESLQAIVSAMAAPVDGPVSVAEGAVGDVLVGALISGKGGPVVELLTGRRAKKAPEQLASMAAVPPIDRATLDRAEKAIAPIEANEYATALQTGYVAAGVDEPTAQALASFQAGRIRYLQQRIQAGRPTSAWRALQAARNVRGTLARVALGKATDEDVAFIAEALPRLRVQMQLVARQLERSGRAFGQPIRRTLSKLAGGDMHRQARLRANYVQRNIFGNPPQQTRQRQRPLKATTNAQTTGQSLAQSLGR